MEETGEVFQGSYEAIAVEGKFLCIQCAILGACGALWCRAGAKMGGPREVSERVLPRSAVLFGAQAR